MTIIDAQLHIDDDHDAESLLEMMDGVGVAAAVLTQSGKQASPDAIVEAAAAHPAKFAAVGVFLPDDPEVEEKLTAWREQPAAVGIRVVLRTEEERARFDQGEFEPVLATAERLGLPFMTFPHAQFDRWSRAAEQHPDLQLVIDHFGQPQPPHAVLADDPWEKLPGLLDLAKHENVAVKFTRAPALSLKPFPFADIWPRLHQVIEAFGLDRLMWGSDITEVHGLHTYEDAVRYMTETDELTEAEKDQLMRGTLTEILGWSAAAG